MIGAAIYDAVGFNTTCEQVVAVRKAQLKLTPGLKVVDNAGVSHPFDEAALDKVLASTTQLPGGVVRMQASKWLPGLTLGPFRYVGTRDDDPNDVIDHEDRRELRGAACSPRGSITGTRASRTRWTCGSRRRRSTSGRRPGHVVHYILDTSDTLGGEVGARRDVARGSATRTTFDFGDIGARLVTFGIDRAAVGPRARDAGPREVRVLLRRATSIPARWKPLYPNPAFLRMTERDGAWMARMIARFSPDDIRRIVDARPLAEPGRRRRT